MKVFIASAANREIPKNYLELAKDISEIFAKNKFDLLFGAGYYSMMGECYKVFRKHNRKIYAYTVPKWEKDFKRIPKAKCYKVSDTLLRFRKLYFAADVMIILPGGIGTIAEFTSAVEEYRSSGGNKRIILYNDNGYYDGLISWIKDNIISGFFIDDLSDCYSIISNLKELNEFVEQYKKNRYVSKKFNSWHINCFFHINFTIQCYTNY